MLGGRDDEATSELAAAWARWGSVGVAVAESGSVLEIPADRRDADDEVRAARPRRTLRFGAACSPPHCAAARASPGQPCELNALSLLSTPPPTRTRQLAMALQRLQLTLSHLSPSLNPPTRTQASLADTTKRELAYTVFCGSSPGNDPVYADAADSVGRAFARAGVTLI